MIKSISKINVLVLSFAFIIASFSLAINPAFADSSTAPNSSISSSTSYNWSGYTAQNSNFTSVTGSWIIPQVSGSNFSGDATWVGIGGVSSQDLIQAGTQAVIDGNGQITYQAWYEMLPAVSTPIAITINPGDSITASINEQTAGSNQWNISIRDNTNGQNFSTTVTYNSSLSSADWIEEMPSQGTGQFIPLDNFNSVQFSNGSTIKDGQLLNLSQAGAQSMTMQNFNGQALASPSLLNSDGASFSVTRTSAQTTSPATNISGFGRGWRRSGRGLNGYSGGRGQNPGAGYITIPNFTIPTSTSQYPFSMFRKQLRQISRFNQLRINFSFSK